MNAAASVEEGRTGTDGGSEATKVDASIEEGTDGVEEKEVDTCVEECIDGGAASIDLHHKSTSVAQTADSEDFLETNAEEMNPTAASAAHEVVSCTEETGVTDGIIVGGSTDTKQTEYARGWRTAICTKGGGLTVDDVETRSRARSIGERDRGVRPEVVRELLVQPDPVKSEALVEPDPVKFIPGDSRWTTAKCTKVGVLTVDDVVTRGRACSIGERSAPGPVGRTGKIGTVDCVGKSDPVGGVGPESSETDMLRAVEEIANASKVAGAKAPQHVGVEEARKRTPGVLLVRGAPLAAPVGGEKPPSGRRKAEKAPVLAVLESSASGEERNPSFEVSSQESSAGTASQADGKKRRKREKVEFEEFSAEELEELLPSDRRVRPAVLEAKSIIQKRLAAMLKRFNETSWGEMDVKGEKYYNEGMKYEAQSKYKEAHELYRRAMRVGCTRARSKLALWYLDGSKYGVETNGETSKALFIRACMEGHVRAMYNLGYLLERGHKDVPTNTEHALFWYRLAAALGNENAMGKFRDLYRRFLRGVASKAGARLTANSGVPPSGAEARDDEAAAEDAEGELATKGELATEGGGTAELWGRLERRLDAMEANLRQLVDQRFRELEEKEANRSWHRRKAEDRSRAEMDNALCAQITKAVSERPMENVRKTVQEELARMNDNVYERLEARMAEVVKRELAQSVENKLLPELRKRFAKSMGKELLSGVTEAVVQGSEGQISSTFRTVLEETVVPAYEVSTKEMFRQIDQAFQQGLRDQFEENVKTEFKRSSNLLAEQLMNAIQSWIAASESAMKSMIADQNQVTSDHLAQVYTLQESSYAKQMDRTRDQLEHLTTSAAAAAGAAAVAAVLQASGSSGGFGRGSFRAGEREASPWEILAEHLHQGEYDAGLRIALEQRDLDVVLRACDRAGRPDDVVGELSPVVRLSLFQQLSVSLTSENLERDLSLSMRLRWLLQCALRLDRKSPDVSPHIPSAFRFTEEALRLLRPRCPPTLGHEFMLLYHIVSATRQ
mmetsp:Transcript_30694/g.85986  ORF Transcript_30694/g.85986 Transcript_30694/m.85986 type:complete len:1016 (-) Transcript_30694:21-3068(-)